MTRFILNRLIHAVLVLAILSFVIYSLIGLMPGDPLDVMLSSTPGITPEAVAHLREIYGLDQPLLSRYWHWLISALGGDFGFSRIHARPVLEVMAPALWQTAKLMLTSFVVSAVLSLVLGIASARKPGGWIDGAVSLFAFAGMSVPVFWLALVLILVFAQTLHWLPASGMSAGSNGGPVEALRHLVLPVATLVLANTGGFTRYVRSSMIETLRLDFIRTARAKGAGEGRVLLVHGLRNAALPIVTMFGLSFGTLFSGALVTETMFAQWGMGKMVYDAILGNDFNLALIGLLFAACMTLISSLVADLAYAWLDPRIDMQ